MKTQFQRLGKEENVQRLNNLKQLQSSIKSYKNQIKTELGKLLQLLEQQVEQIQLEIEKKESKLEIKNYDEEIQILSKTYTENFSYNIPKQLTYMEKDLALVQIIYETLQSQQQSQNFNQILVFIDLIKHSVPVIQSANINQIPDREFNQHKAPCLNQVCNKNNKETIMVSIDQNKPEFRWHAQNALKIIRFNILVQKTMIKVEFIYGIIKGSNFQISLQKITIIQYSYKRNQRTKRLLQLITIKNDQNYR
ncbi:unnamed protein product [Paramecium octaurelia]|uniref:Uncharacterized protein n=1 Tax=Paramecium octaurelia TaxID=43137 RepID=A0A8S1YS64_PAROT|nr:unnamed protein product [Paramecium octaurelia]CAD8214874.1 unnamed protein product [Paramecium octaurelia]